MTVVGEAFVKVMPEAKGFQKSLEAQIMPALRAAEKTAGKGGRNQSGSNLAKNFAPSIGAMREHGQKLGKALAQGVQQGMRAHNKAKPNAMLDAMLPSKAAIRGRAKAMAQQFAADFNKQTKAAQKAAGAGAASSLVPTPAAAKKAGAQAAKAAADGAARQARRVKGQAYPKPNPLAVGQPAISEAYKEAQRKHRKVLNEIRKIDEAAAKRAEADRMRRITDPLDAMERLIRQEQKELRDARAKEAKEAERAARAKAKADARIAADAAKARQAADAKAAKRSKEYAETLAKRNAAGDPWRVESLDHDANMARQIARSARELGTEYGQTAGSAASRSMSSALGSGVAGQQFGKAVNKVGSAAKKGGVWENVFSPSKASMTRSLGSSLNAAGRSLTWSASGGAGLALGMAGYLGAAYESAVSRAVSVSQDSFGNGFLQMSQASKSQIEAAYSKKALDVAGRTVFNPQEAASALEMLGKGGLNAEQSLSALDTTINFAVAGQMELADAATLSLTAFNMFDKSLAKTHGNLKSTTGAQSAMTEVGDKLAAAANKSSADISDMGQSLDYVGTQAAGMGLSVGDVSTALGVLGLRGLRGSKAGTQLGQFFSHLIPTTEAAGQAFKDIKFDAFKSNGEMKDMTTIVGELSSAMGGMSQKKRAGFVKTAFGTLGGRAARALFQDGKKSIALWDDVAGAVNNSEGALVSLEQASMGPTQRAFERMKGSLQELGIVLGQAFAPTIISWAEGIQGIAEALSAMPQDKLNNLAKGLTAVAALGPAIWLAGGTARALSSIQSLGAAVVGMGKRVKTAQAAGGASGLLPGLMFGKRGDGKRQMKDGNKAATLAARNASKMKDAIMAGAMGASMFTPSMFASMMGGKRGAPDADDIKRQLGGVTAATDKNTRSQGRAIATAREGSRVAVSQNKSNKESIKVAGQKAAKAAEAVKHEMATQQALRGNNRMLLANMATDLLSLRRGKIPGGGGGAKNGGLMGRLFGKGGPSGAAKEAGFFSRQLGSIAAKAPMLARFGNIAKSFTPIGAAVTVAAVGLGQMYQESSKLQAMGDSVKTAWSNLFTTSGEGGVFSGLTDGLGAALAPIGKMLDPVLGSFQSVLGKIGDGIGSVFEPVNNVFSNVGSFEGMLDGVARMLGHIGEAFASVGDFFGMDTEAMRADIDSLFADLDSRAETRKIKMEIDQAGILAEANNMDVKIPVGFDASGEKTGEFAQIFKGKGGNAFKVPLQPFVTPQGETLYKAQLGVDGKPTKVPIAADDAQFASVLAGLGKGQSITIDIKAVPKPGDGGLAEDGRPNLLKPVEVPVKPVIDSPTDALLGGKGITIDAQPGTTLTGQELVTDPTAPVNATPGTTVPGSALVTDPTAPVNATPGTTVPGSALVADPSVPVNATPGTTVPGEALVTNPEVPITPQVQVPAGGIVPQQSQTVPVKLEVTNKNAVDAAIPRGAKTVSVRLAVANKNAVNAAIPKGAKTVTVRLAVANRNAVNAAIPKGAKSVSVSVKVERGQLDALIASIGGLNPPPVTVTADTGAAVAAVQALSDAIAAVPLSTTVTVTATVNGLGEIQALIGAIASVQSKTVTITAVRVGPSDEAVRGTIEDGDPIVMDMMVNPKLGKGTPEAVDLNSLFTVSQGAPLTPGVASPESPVAAGSAPSPAPAPSGRAGGGGGGGKSGGGVGGAAKRLISDLEEFEKIIKKLGVGSLEAALKKYKKSAKELSKKGKEAWDKAFGDIESKAKDWRDKLKATSDQLQSDIAQAQRSWKFSSRGTADDFKQIAVDMIDTSVLEAANGQQRKMLRRIGEMSKKNLDLLAMRMVRYESARELRDTLSESARGFVDWNEYTKPEDLKNRLKQVTGHFETYARDMQALRGLGASDTLMQRLAEMGPEEGAILARALVTGGRTTVKELSAAWVGYENSVADIADKGAAAAWAETGKQAAAGFVKGMEEDEKKIRKAVQKVADMSVAAFKKALGISSPSKVMAKQGRAMNQGVAKGLKGKDGEKAGKKAGKNIEKAIAEGATKQSKKNGKDALKQQRALEKKLAKQRKQSKKKLARGGKPLPIVERPGAGGSAESVEEGLLSSEELKEREEKAADEHRQRVDRVVSALQQSFDGIKGAIRWDEVMSPASLKRQLDRTTAYLAAANRDIGTLRGLGLSEAVIQEIGKMDPKQAAKFTQRLLADPSMVSSLNASYGAFEKVGLQMSAGLANGALREERRMEDVMTYIANHMVGSLKDVLKIESPSKVMAEQGRMVSLGVAKGVSQEYDAVRNAISKLDMTPSLGGWASQGDARNASGGGGNVQIDVHPAPGMSERQLARAVGREFSWRL